MNSDSVKKLPRKAYKQELLPPRKYYFLYQDFPCQPKGGSALVFTQNLLHEGSLVKKGIKYTMRTEIMYRQKPVKS